VPDTHVFSSWALARPVNVKVKIASAKRLKLDRRVAARFVIVCSSIWDKRNPSGVFFTSTKILREGAQGDVTQLLAQWGQGDRSALDAATRLVYAEHRKIADSYLQHEHGEITLQPTALIQEAYLRLVKEEHPSFDNRRKFFAFSARLMREILVDHARSRGAESGVGAP
jgi:hypothetical protein